MAEKVSGAVWAAQPVTTMRACGRSRRSFRIFWRAWRTASPVTAQVLTMIVSAISAARAWPRITCDSKALSRQPKVTTSTVMGTSGRAGGGQHGIEAAGILEFDRTGHQHVIVRFPPFAPEIAARQGDPDLAAGSAGARAAYRGRTG